MKSAKLIFFISLIFLSACDSQHHSPPLQIGTNLWPGYEPLYISESLGYFSKDELRLVVLPSASEVMRSFKNQIINVAALTLDEALLLAESGADIVVIQVADISHGADVILVNSEIESFSQLSGKKVGLESTALGAYVLSRALEINQLQLKDVQLVDLEIGEQEKAFAAGEVDAVVTFEPVKTHLENHGAKVIFDSSQIPGEVVDVLVVRKDVFDEQKEQLQYLVDGWYKGVGYIEQHPEKAAEIAGRHLGISAQEFKEALSGLIIPTREVNRQMISDGKLQKTVKQLKNVMLDHQLLSGDAVTITMPMTADLL